uniref:40S ribosomal protein S26 n=1 Tax=Caenorhabditis tropicalis TaxID=1561998 RepID=A0A1I7UYQ7_9PELO
MRFVFISFDSSKKVPLGDTAGRGRKDNNGHVKRHMKRRNVVCHSCKSVMPTCVPTENSFPLYSRTFGV